MYICNISHAECVCLGNIGKGSPDVTDVCRIQGITYMEKAFITRFVLWQSESVGNFSITVEEHGNGRCPWVWFNASPYCIYVTTACAGVAYACYDICISIKGAGISYRRGGLRLLVLTVWAIPTASVCGASKGYRLHVFFVYVNNLYLTVNCQIRETIGKNIY